MTLDPLWKINLGTGFNAPPMTFEVNGKQYIAILSGLSPISKRRHSHTPELREMRHQTMLFVFGLWNPRRAGKGAPTPCRPHNRFAALRAPEDRRLTRGQEALGGAPSTFLAFAHRQRRQSRSTRGGRP